MKKDKDVVNQAVTTKAPALAFAHVSLRQSTDFVSAALGNHARLAQRNIREWLQASQRAFNEALEEYDEKLKAAQKEIRNLETKLAGEKKRTKTTEQLQLGPFAAAGGDVEAVQPGLVVRTPLDRLALECDDIDPVETRHLHGGQDVKVCALS